MPQMKMDKVELHYEEYGNGEPLVLLHDGLSCTKSFTRQIPEFSSRFRVIAYDRYGYGRSTHMTVLRENWLEENVAELLALLDQFEIKHAHLCGLCVGGTIALLFAAKNPERTGRVAVAGTCCYNEDCITSAVLKFYPPPEDLPPDWVEELSHCHGEDYARELYGIFYRAIREENGYPFKGYDLRQALSSVRTPVIIIHGDGDGLFGVEQALVMHKHLPGSELYVVPNCGHLPNEEKPEDFNREVLRFLVRRP